MMTVGQASTFLLVLSFLAGCKTSAEGSHAKDLLIETSGSGGTHQLALFYTVSSQVCGLKCTVDALPQIADGQIPTGTAVFKEPTGVSCDALAHCMTKAAFYNAFIALSEANEAALAGSPTKAKVHQDAEDVREQIFATNSQFLRATASVDAADFAKLLPVLSAHDATGSAPDLGRVEAFIHHKDPAPSPPVRPAPAVASTPAQGSTAVPPRPLASTAAGVALGGATWYLSAVAENCAQRCTGLGLTYDAATANYSGSNGSLANCTDVLASFGHTGSAIDINGCSGIGFGCEFRGDSLQSQAYRCSDTETSADAIDGTTYRRACACKPIGPEVRTLAARTDGVTVGGATWYLSNMAENCAQRCSGVSLAFDEATVNVTGSSGSLANCIAVLAAFGHTGSTADINGCAGAGYGCEVRGDSLQSPGFRCTATPTSAEAVDGTNYMRACACR